MTSQMGKTDCESNAIIRYILFLTVEWNTEVEVARLAL